jgi:sensor histidine kinase YesM
VDNYIYILNVRFAGDITYYKEVDEDVEDIQIPSMILQPVVENAVQHGIHDCMEEGWIHLEVHRQDDMIAVTVSDNGAGMTEETIREVMEGRAHTGQEKKYSTGIAMDNVIRRLQLYYNQENLLQIESDGPGQGTQVRIWLPLE